MSSHRIGQDVRSVEDAPLVVKLNFTCLNPFIALMIGDKNVVIRRGHFPELHPIDGPL